MANSNRVIKFRAWDFKYKRWVSVESAIWFDKGDIKLKDNEHFKTYKVI